VLEDLLSGGSVLLLVGEELLDEVLSLVGDVLPGLVVEVEGALTDLAHDLLVGLSVEGRLSGKKDVGDDTAGPDIALGVVVLVEDLRGDVVGGSELLVKGTGRVEDEGSTEIDDLDLIELLVLLEEDVLGLQVSAKIIARC
jgi:hypothetical protein